MKKLISAVLALIAVLICATGCSDTASGGDNYEYEGFVIDVYENARGDTVIVCLSDDVESEYVIKKSTKISAPGETPIAIGDHVMLSTTSRSDDAVERIKVSLGHSSEGRLIYVEGDESPFLLTGMNDGTRLLIKLVDERGTLPGVSGIGDVIKVYHRAAIERDDPVAKVEAMTFVENGTAADLMDEDIAFIESKGYTVVAE